MEISSKIQSIYIYEITFDNNIYKNFYSKAHLIKHAILGVIELGIGVMETTSLPGFLLGVSFHFLLAFGTYIYDLKKEIITLKENMQNFDKSLIIKFEGDKIKIEEILKVIRTGVENGIEAFVDSQNSEFKGIKKSKNIYNKLYSEFKNINHIK